MDAIIRRPKIFTSGGGAPFVQVTPYEGPGDIVSGAAMWVGLRAYSSASIGSNAVRLRRDGDSSEQDFATVSGGGLDLSAISTFLAGVAPPSTNLFVSKLYDQSGNSRDLANVATA